MSEFETKKTEAEAIAEISAKPSLHNESGNPFAYVPAGWVRDDFRYLLPNPRRKTGHYNLHEVESFIDIVKRQGSLANCNIYLNVDYGKQKINAIAIFNDHADGDGPAGWRDHSAIYEPKFSEEWRRWTAHSGKHMTQIELGNFLEGNISDIATPVGTTLPTGSEVLSFVTALQETRKVKYGSTIDLANGMKQIEFIEEGSDAQKGKLSIFREFALGIRPFINGQAYELRAYLRYRVDRNNGNITFWYELQRPDRLLEDACRKIVHDIKTKTGMPVLFGSP